MISRPWFLSLWALVAFWVWALHVATGFFDDLIAARSGKRSGILSMLNSVTDLVLVGPLGRPVTVVFLLVAGAGSAIVIYRLARRRLGA